MWEGQQQAESSSVFLGALGMEMGWGPQGVRRAGSVGFLAHKPCAGALLRGPQISASLNGTIIYVNAFVVHIWVRVKYGPASFTGGNVNCAPLAEDRYAFGGCRSPWQPPREVVEWPPRGQRQPRRVVDRRRGPGS